VVIPNVFDFHALSRGVDDFNRSLKSDLGMKEEDLLILQPTRIIARKGIEHAIELASRLKERKVKVLISHQERDEGNAYYHRIMDYAQHLNVDLVLGGDLMGQTRGFRPDGKKIYDLWDCYAIADFVTYPSSYEGFGNAFLEAIFCRKPILVNRYAIFETDIEPLGFKTAVIENYVTEETLKQVRRLLDDEEHRAASAFHNFELGKKLFSYELLEKKLKAILDNFGTVG